jgi:hypothetical protein
MVKQQASSLDVPFRMASLAPVHAYWSSALALAGTLAGFDRSEWRAERLVSDRDISAGYLHSGYPIMAFLDMPAYMLRKVRLTSGATAIGTFAVTARLLQSLMIFLHICSQKSHPKEHGDLSTKSGTITNSRHSCWTGQARPFATSGMHFAQCSFVSVSIGPLFWR